MDRLHALLSATLFLWACSCPGGGTDTLGADMETFEASLDHRQEDAARADSEEAEAQPAFEHQLFSHKEAAGLGDLQTGDYFEFSFEYPAIEVEADYKHVLNFLITPLMPPYLKATPTNGPLVLYTDKMEAIVFSPLDHFYSSLVHFEDGLIHYGLHGDLGETPEDFQHRFVLVRGHGINATVAEWGRILVEDSGLPRPDRYADKGLSHLGYWTDNGAAYYYKNADGMNEEQTLLAVKQDADDRGIPYGYMQLDSWWYFKEKGDGILSAAAGGLILWEPQPEMFPDGLVSFQEKLGLPLVAHNRWFAVDNGYVDDHEFIFEEKMALPVGQALFDHFMEDAIEWGVFTYEQDWLVTQYWGLDWLRNGVGHAAQWVQAMHDAAFDAGLTMQMCMAGTANLMQAASLPAVTTIRTSVDYAKNVSKETYWPQFHTVNMLAAAVGIWPFKDNFQMSEKWGEAEALISSLSAGMVGSGDAIGKADPQLLARTCMADGLLLKPDRPATPVDAMFLGHKRPFITSTFSDQPALGRTLYLAAYLLARKHPERTAWDRAWFQLRYDDKDPGDMFVFPDQVTDWHVDLKQDLGIDGPAVIYNWRTGDADLVQNEFDIPAMEHLYDHSFFVIAPIQANDLALIGETGKHITLADARFKSIDVTDDSIEVTLAGVPGEEVSLLAFDTDAGQLLEPMTVVVDDNGVGVGLLRRDAN